MGADIRIQMADTEAVIHRLNDEVDQLRTDKEKSTVQVCCTPKVEGAILLSVALVSSVLTMRLK